MKFTPHDYQRRAVEWIETHPRCLLFLEMGLGKTAICLSAVARLLRFGEVSRVLVIAPKKVAEGTWSDEAARWDHLAAVRVVNVDGTPTQRLRALNREGDVYVIGRDSVCWLIDTLGKGFDFDMVILDELTSFKNPRALRFKALKRVLPGVGRVVGLTGTPTPNGLLDLWAQVYCIDGGERLGKYLTHYRDRWFNPIMFNNIVIKCPPKKGAKEEIMGLISDIALAMRSEDWLQLPPLVREDVSVVLPAPALKQYKAFEAEKVLEIVKDCRPLTAESAGTLVNKLAQFANGAVYDEDRNVVEFHREKIAALEEIYYSEESPLLVFYQYKHDCSRILKHFEEKRALDGTGMIVRVYSGYDDLRDWNKGVVDILLAHPASTAFGLNMQQGGHRIVWFSTGWNLEQYQQANARLYRQGQTRPVRVFNLVATGTVDERMAAALGEKSETQRKVVQQLAATIINDISKS